MKNKISTYWLITGLLVLIKVTVHILVFSSYELHRDEMLYFAQGSHLSFGYISTPPFVGFLAFLARTLFGYSEFGLKLFPTVAGGASMFIVALFVKELGGKIMALITAGIGYLAAGAFLRSNSLFMPVCFDQFFWLLSSYLVLKMVNTNNTRLWLWIGFVLGLAFLNKYAIVFFAFALLMALLLSEHRKLLHSRFLWFGVFIGFATIIPNLFWQHTHNWPVAGHMIELQRTQLVNVTTSNYLTEQVFMCFSSIFIWLSGLIFILLPRERKNRFIGVAFLLVVLIILLGRGKPYYTLGAYPMLMAVGGYALEKYFTGKLLIINYAFWVFAISISILALPLALPYASFERVKKYCDPQTGLFPQRWEDGQIHPIPQDYADMTGWKELTGIVAKAYNQLDSVQKNNCTIYAENYGQAGAIQFYGRRVGLPEPISFCDSYLLWTPDTISNGLFIYVNDEVGDMDELFNQYPQIGQVNNQYFRENGIIVLLCTDPKIHWQEFYADKVKSLKSNYRKP